MIKSLVPFKRNHNCRKCGADEWVPRGNTSQCYPCRKKSTKKYAIANKERMDAWRIGYEKENREKIAKQKAAYKEKHKEHLARKNSEYQKANKGKSAARTAGYRAKKMMAVPLWADSNAIELMYEKARAMTFSSTKGVAYHVDHIVPIQGRHVCGLHTQANLQILTSSENQSKGNRI